MNNKSNSKKFAVLIALVIGGGLAAYWLAAPVLSQQVQQKRSSALAYAQLTIQGENQAIWDEGGNAIPRVDTLDGTYRRLGGTSRTSVVNVLNAIGNNGWELVEVTSNVWTFKR